MTVLQNVPGCKKWQGLLAKVKFVFDLFHILLNGFLRILKRKLKEKHFCFIEKMIVQSVVLIIKKKQKTIDRYITEDKYAKEL